MPTGIIFVFYFHLIFMNKLKDFIFGGGRLNRRQFFIMNIFGSLISGLIFFVVTVLIVGIF